MNLMGDPMSHRRFVVWLGLLSCTAMVLMTPVSGSERALSEPRMSTASRSIVVTTSAELLAALAAGTDLNIFMQSGTYQLSQAIRVPENTALIGEGTMLYDDSGLPTGFIPESRTVIAAAPGVTGDFVTLGDGASLQGLVIQDVVRPALTGGVVVMVTSRGPSVSVSVQITGCEIVTPNPRGATTTGPTGHGLSAITRNSPLAGGGVAHEQSLVSVHLTRSIIRAPGGGDSIFTLNYASGSHIGLHLRQNVLGRLGANGGVSRPDSTVGATLSIQSSGNLYRADTATTLSGWTFNGGSDAAAGLGLSAGPTLNNKLSMHSVDDRIDGFARAIAATAGNRMSALAGAISSNEVELILHGTRLASITSDFQLFGARSLPVGVATGDGNELRVTIHQVIGSGPRTNTYGDFTQSPGIGNRLLFTGNLNAFSHTNEAILPLPGAQFFTAGR